MNVNSHAMRGVKVETRAGQAVGRVASFDLDAATGRLASMRVKSGGFIPGLLDDELLVPWDGILEMTAERVIVADAFAVATARTIAQNNAVAPSSGFMKEG